MNACFCNGIQNPPTWRVFLLEWVAVLRVEWVAGLVSLQVEGFDRYVWLSWGGIRSQAGAPRIFRAKARLLLSRFFSVWLGFAICRCLERHCYVSIPFQ